jgi:hypothetical protein
VPAVRAVRVMCVRAVAIGTKTSAEVKEYSDVFWKRIKEIKGACVCVCM